MSEQAISPRLMRWLEVSSYGGVMYRGCNIDCAPKVFSQLEKLGLVEIYSPHNPAHKDKAMATDAGRAMLAARKVQR
jgi:hypothetical protein